MLDPAFYERLSRLKLAVDKKSNAALLGSRKSTRKGSSAEFSDFREYMPGDDIRAIDWNAYARLDRLYIKEYMEEKESRISFFLDFSRSMEYGDKKKSQLARELCEALAYIALMNQDHVAAFDLSDPARHYTAGSGKAGFRELDEWLDKQAVGSPADISRVISSVGRMQPGLSLIISDFLSEEFVEGGEQLLRLIRFLQYMRQKVVILHVLAKEELDIELSGTCFLIDSENKEERLRVTMESSAIKRYGEELARFTDSLRRAAKRCGAAYHLISTGDPLDRVVFEELFDIYEY